MHIGNILLARELIFVWTFVTWRSTKNLCLLINNLITNLTITATFKLSIYSSQTINLQLLTFNSVRVTLWGWTPLVPLGPCLRNSVQWSSPKSQLFSWSVLSYRLRLVKVSNGETDIRVRANPWAFHWTLGLSRVQG